MNRIGLLSYPKSGSNWLSYCIEYLTDIEVVGRDSGKFGIHTVWSKARLPDVPYRKDVVIEKFHCLDVGKSTWENVNYDKLIFILRNYKECVYNFENTFNLLLTEERDVNYVRILKLFDSFPRKKIVVYYEDLMTLPKEELKKICTFLNCDNEFFEEFFCNFHEHKMRSLQLYRGPGGAKSNGELIHHSKDIDTKILQSIDKEFENKYPILFDKYLRRYCE